MIVSLSLNGTTLMEFKVYVAWRRDIPDNASYEKTRAVPGNGCRSCLWANCSCLGTKRRRPAVRFVRATCSCVRFARARCDRVACANSSRPRFCRTRVSGTRARSIWPEPGDEPAEAAARECQLLRKPWRACKRSGQTTAGSTFPNFRRPQRMSRRSCGRRDWMTSRSATHRPTE